MAYALLGMGTALPPHFANQADAADFAKQVAVFNDGQQRMASTIYRRAGVAKRHSVLLDRPEGVIADRQSFYDLTGDSGRGPGTAARMDRYARFAGPLAESAAAAALADADLPASQVTHLVTVSCSGFAAPGVDVHLLRNLGLPPTAQRVHVGFMGCHGAINGLRVAQALAESGPQARVLLAAVELCTLHHFSGWDIEKVVANALFADGAAAVVVGPASAGEPGGWQGVATGSMLLPDSVEAMSWTIGDHGFEMTLSADVPRKIETHLRPWMNEWLAGHGVSVEGVGSWAIHPGGPKIVDAAAAALGLPEEALADSRGVLADCGNMSSPTVLFILDRLRQRSAPRPCVALAFGPGLMAEAALFR